MLFRSGVKGIVHPVKVQCGNADQGTVARIEALVAKEVISSALGKDLTESLHFFMGLKLKGALTEMDVQQPVSGTIDVGQLSSLERDLLKDALGVVKHFKSLLRGRFKLDAL